jgi:hypothetical protein
MGLLDEMMQETAIVNGQCSVARFLELVPEEERADIAALLVDNTVPITKLLNVIRRNGYKLGDSSAYNHRKGLCKCH